MGVFDTVEVRGRRCPACKKMVDRWSYQFKWWGTPSMKTVRIGEPLIEKRVVLEGLGTCARCGKPVSCRVVIERGAVTRVDRLRLDRLRLPEARQREMKERTRMGELMTHLTRAATRRAKRKRRK